MHLIHLELCLDKDAEDKIIRKAEIMGVVVATGKVLAGDRIGIEFRAQSYKNLERV